MRDAYLRTSYWVDTPHGAIRLRVGERNAALDSVLSERSLTTWAFLTAYNPHSNPLSDAENAERQRTFTVQVTGFGFQTFTGRGIGDDGNWPAEESLLILGITRETALTLAQTWEQNAFVHGVVGDVPELVWCSDDSLGETITGT